MNTSRHSVVVLLLALGVWLVGCQHATHKDAAQKPALPWAGFGEPGTGKITVFVAGYVANQGRYHFSDSVTLADLPHLVGGFISCQTCGHTPTLIRVLRGTEKLDFSLTGENKKEIETFCLRDGDIINYFVRHW